VQQNYRVVKQNLVSMQRIPSLGGVRAISIKLVA
jgi:hypothetical protein